MTSNAVAQNPLSVSKPAADSSVAAELKSFTLTEGYQANLFADETDGVANPVCMSWDPAGRLWVLVTAAYPQLKPTDKPSDKLLILTDTNADGRADKTTVFADGLNMPTGFALGSRRSLHRARQRFAPSERYRRRRQGRHASCTVDRLWHRRYTSKHQLVHLESRRRVVFLSGSARIFPRRNTLGNPPLGRTRLLAVATEAAAA